MDTVLRFLLNCSRAERLGIVIGGLLLVTEFSAITPTSPAGKDLMIAMIPMAVGVAVLVGVALGIGMSKENEGIEK